MRAGRFWIRNPKRWLHRIPHQVLVYARIDFALTHGLNLLRSRPLLFLRRYNWHWLLLICHNQLFLLNLGSPHALRACDCIFTGRVISGRKVAIHVDLADVQLPIDDRRLIEYLVAVHLLLLRWIMRAQLLLV